MAEQVLPEISGSETALVYKVDDVAFTFYGVYVTSSTGLQDLPAMKEPQTVDWPDEHGHAIDLTSPRYNSREIELDCFIKASGKLDFYMKVRAFIQAFQKPYLRTLELWIADKPLVYKVYLADAINIEKRWHDVEMFGTFTLKLIEPRPVKRLIRCNSTLVSLKFTTDNPVDVYWGDGSAEYSVKGIEVTLTKSFPTANQRHILITGVIEEISDFEILSDNTTVVWSKY